MGDHSPFLHPPHLAAAAAIDEQSPPQPIRTTAGDNTRSTGDSTANASPLSGDPLEPQSNGQKITLNLKGKKGVSADAAARPSCSSSSSSSLCTQHSLRRCNRLATRRRNPRFLVRRRASDAGSIAFPLGMAIAAVVSQILERKDAINEKTSVDHLSMICTSAVRESLVDVFGNKFDAFAGNFEKSFTSTLSTLRLIEDLAMKKRDDGLIHRNLKNYNSSTDLDMLFNNGECSSKAEINCSCLESIMPAVNAREELRNVEAVQESHLTYRQMIRPLTSSGFTSIIPSYSRNHFMLDTLEKSVVEQARANDLKTFEIGLIMKKLRMKETQIALDSELNFLERCKLFMGTSKASFKAEKFKTQVKDTRHAELLRNCIDCLIAGLLIMSASLAYGAYVYSYRRIAEATLSCSLPKESKSWWFPKPMASFNSSLQTLTCHVQVFSRMLFGILLILAIAYSLIQRPVTTTQTMPVTFILLLLGFGCGFAGKLCVDTLGGSGYHWLIYWEVFCALHFLTNAFTPTIYYILHGPIRVFGTVNSSLILPYRVRRILFYLAMLFVVPSLCGFMPFAGLGEWKDHFTLLITNMFVVKKDEN
ncbi:hypothetical protein Nepgr_026368 [Nepenthes gracilis]|uniref:Protein CPR-5 n=1 Tax=Nepenthes gracilis TaxID=150966 RepID=A0AAD3Y1Z1_NEPGR|nr:hypothetical protein Nepgr_026368 [Nepenthes gracilis]